MAFDTLLSRQYTSISQVLMKIFQKLDYMEWFVTTAWRGSMAECQHLPLVQSGSFLANVTRY